MPKRRDENEVIEGAASAIDVYLAVGIALSWWEASEDQLMALFHVLVGMHDKILHDLYLEAPRQRRNAMVKAAVEHLAKKLVTDDEKRVLYRTMGALDKLAATRNEIAHGHCSNVTERRGETLVMNGNFLLPALSEGMRVDRRTHRYYHTPSSMEEFTNAVREHRDVVMDMVTSVMLRQQEQRSTMDDETRSLNDFIDQVSNGTFDRSRVTKFIQLVKRG